MPVDAIARRLEQPLLARARGSSVERAQAIAAADAAPQAPTLSLAFYLEGDDGLRWEFPELRDAARGCAASPPSCSTISPTTCAELELHV